MQAETQKIIQGINQKDSKAWKIFFESFYAPLCQYSYKILKDKQIAHDVVQDVLLSLWKSEIIFETPQALISYLYKAVINNSLKFLRNRQIETHHLQIWQEELSEETFADIVKEEVIRKLYNLINQLPHERRKILLMSLEGMSGEEIATQLGITIHTVKQQKYRAYKFMREHLGIYKDLLLSFLFF